MRAADIFFALIRFEMFGIPVPEDVKADVTEEKLKAVMQCAEAHDISQIISSALIKNSLFAEEAQKELFERKQLLAVYRYQGMKRELEEISRLFSEAEIPFVPLKGAFIRDLYPEPWMRTSCDIDLLVKECDLERAARLICEKLEYKTEGNRDFHDVSLRSPSNVHLELHFNLLENLENIDRLLARAWDFAVPSGNGGTEYRFTNEFLLFHVVAHMSYHFIFGGCGVRSFIDLRILENRLEYDESVFLKMLCECGLERFYETVKKLSLVWFDGAKHDELTDETEKYIVLGGAFGDHKKGIAAQQARSGGKATYLLGRIFQPYNVIKEKYPILKKHPILLPFYQIKRWLDLLSRGELSRLKKEYDADKDMKGDRPDKINVYLAKLGLK